MPEKPDINEYEGIEIEADELHDLRLLGQLIENTPPMPPNAFTVLGASGWFAVEKSTEGHFVGRWKEKRSSKKVSEKFTEYTLHIIPNGGKCDCKQSQFGNICSHHKALQTYLDKQEHARWVAQHKAKEEAERLERNRYQVQFLPLNSLEFQDCGIYFGELKFAIQQMEKLVFTRQAIKAEIVDRVEGTVIDFFPKGESSMGIKTTTGSVKYTAGKAINTQYGERINAVITLPDGDEIKLWGKPDDQSLRALKKNQSVQLFNDGKSWKLLENNSNGSQYNAPPTPQNSRWTKEEGALFRELLADYGYAYELSLARAREMHEKSLLPAEHIGSAATALFLTCCKKMGK